MTRQAVLEHVCYWYPAWAGPAPAALADVTAELWPGLTVLAGDSGSGKSTLLRVLNGLVPHFYGGRFAGSATVNGMAVTETPTRTMARTVGFVLQEFQSGFVRSTVEREVAFASENLALPPERIRAQIPRALDQVGVAHLAGRRLSTLSGGERQRVALAAVLAAEPSVVAMDEPTSQLDDDGALRLVTVLERLAGAGHVVVVAEQRLGRLPSSSRFIHLAGGRVVDRPRASAGPSPSAFSSAFPPASSWPSPLAGGAGRGRGRQAWALEDATVGVDGRAVLSDVRLAGAEGEIVVLVGPNGAGKTTLLRAVAGLTPVLSGRAERRPGRVAYLPQDPGSLLHRRSVAAEVRQTLRWCGSDDDPTALLEALDLVDLAERDPRDLSGGQRQRAALAAVLTGRPGLALLDEPTRGMDAAARASLKAVLRACADAGGSVVVATHDQPLAAELGDQVVEVRDGRAVVIGPREPGTRPATGRQGPQPRASVVVTQPGGRAP